MTTRRAFTKSALALAGAGLMPFQKATAGDGISAKQAGFYLPEETVRHERTFMQWPVSREVHPDRVFLNMCWGMRSLSFSHMARPRRSACER